MVSTPSPPDPYQTAAAQTASNEQTANYQQALNMTNQVTPYGDVTYNQTGTAPNGAPRYTATTTLDPSVSNLVNSNIGNAQAQSGIEGQLAGNAASEISTPLNLGPSALSQQMDAWNRSTLDPQWAQLDKQNDQQLYDQGLTVGSPDYAQARQNFFNDKNQAYNQAYLSDEQQAQNALIQQYNEPLNALTALQSGSQISQPGVGQTAQAPQTGVQATNLAGLVEANYQQQVAQSNAAMGGLFGLGGGLLNIGAQFL